MEYCCGLCFREEVTCFMLLKYNKDDILQLRMYCKKHELRMKEYIALKDFILVKEITKEQYIKWITII